MLRYRATLCRTQALGLSIRDPTLYLPSGKEQKLNIEGCKISSGGWRVPLRAQNPIETRQRQCDWEADRGKLNMECSSQHAVTIQDASRP